MVDAIDHRFRRRSMEMKDLRQRMIADMKLRGLTSGTQGTYLEAVKALAKHYNRRPDEINEQQIREYLIHLNNKFAKSTFKVHLFAIKFLYQRTLGREWPVLQLTRVRTDKRLPVILSRDEVWSLLDQIRRPQARMSLTLMYTCGLRVSEAVNLRLDDINSQRKVIWVRNGKGSKDRSVPLPAETLAQLRAYWSQYRPKTWLFPSRRGDTAITSGAVRRCLKATLWRSNIRKKVSCPTLRHSSATHLLEAGVHLRAIQALLGHRSLKTTFIYMHLSQSTMADVQTKVNKLMTRH